MSGRLLDFKSYIGGQDNVQVIEMTPSTQTTYQYNYGTDVSAYSFEVDYQTLVIDTLAYQRESGLPNFTDSTVVGYFANAEVGNANIDTGSAATGIVNITIPSQRYTGNIVPDARANVPITVLSVKWTNGGVTPNTTTSHRWAIIERYEPDVTPGNPRNEAGFTALTT